MNNQKTHLQQWKLFASGNDNFSLRFGAYCAETELISFETETSKMVAITQPTIFDPPTPA